MPILRWQFVLVSLFIALIYLASRRNVFLYSIEQGLVLHIDTSMLISDCIYHLSLRFNLLYLYRVSFAESLRRIILVWHVRGVVLVQPADCSCLNPSARLWLNFAGCLALHM